MAQSDFPTRPVTLVVPSLAGWERDDQRDRPRPESRYCAMAWPGAERASARAEPCDKRAATEDHRQFRRHDLPP